MTKRYKYEFDVEGYWEQLTDTLTGQKIEGHRISVNHVFFLLGLNEQLEIEEKYFDEEWV